MTLFHWTDHQYAWRCLLWNRGSIVLSFCNYSCVSAQASRSAYAGNNELISSSEIPGIISLIIKILLLGTVQICCPDWLIWSSDFCMAIRWSKSESKQGWYQDGLDVDLTVYHSWMTKTMRVKRQPATPTAVAGETYSCVLNGRWDLGLQSKRVVTLTLHTNSGFVISTSLI